MCIELSSKNGISRTAIICDTCGKEIRDIGLAMLFSDGHGQNKLCHKTCDPGLPMSQELSQVLVRILGDKFNYSKTVESIKDLQNL